MCGIGVHNVCDVRRVEPWEGGAGGVRIGVHGGLEATLKQNNLIHHCIHRFDHVGVEKLTLLALSTGGVCDSGVEVSMRDNFQRLRTISRCTKFMSNVVCTTCTFAGLQTRGGMSTRVYLYRRLERKAQGHLMNEKRKCPLIASGKTRTPTRGRNRTNRCMPLCVCVSLSGPLRLSRRSLYRGRRAYVHR